MLETTPALVGLVVWAVLLLVIYLSRFKKFNFFGHSAMIISNVATVALLCLQNWPAYGICIFVTVTGMHFLSVTKEAYRHEVPSSPIWLFLSILVNFGVYGGLYLLNRL